MNICQSKEMFLMCDRIFKQGYFCRFNFSNYVTFSSKEDEDLAKNYAAPDYYILPNSKKVYDELSTLFFV